MDKFFAYYKYFAQALKAISNGLEVIANDWPTDNPFGSDQPEKKGKGTVIHIKPEADQE